MKVFYATYLVSFYFYLSLVTASPVRPGSTTLSPVAESQARAFNAPRARNVTSEAVPVPLSTGSAETGTEEQASSEATPTQASAALSEGQATPEISATATETQDASETQASSEAQTTSESQTSETQTTSETSVSVTEMTSAAPEMTGTATENQAAPQITAAATESQAAPEMTSTASGMASQSEASPTQAEASPQETMGSSPSPSPSVSEEAPNSEAHRVHKASPKQGNLCKTGDSYCCDEKDGSMLSTHPGSTIYSPMLTSMFS